MASNAWRASRKGTGKGGRLSIRRRRLKIICENPAIDILQSDPAPLPLFGYEKRRKNEGTRKERKKAFRGREGEGGAGRVSKCPRSGGTALEGQSSRRKANFSSFLDISNGSHRGGGRRKRGRKSQGTRP